jgi:peptidoglycan/LPS O-acetylase OafA/YrhL
LVNLFFPVFSILTLGFNRFIALSILIIASGFCLWLTISNGWSLDIARSNSSGPFIRCATEFTIGMLIFRWHKTHIGPPRILLPLLAISVLVLLHFKLIDIGIVALMSVGIPLLSQDNGIIARVLSVSPLIWLGNLSFSIYLTQEPILRVVRHFVLLKVNEPNAEVVIFVLGTVSITILVSFITNRLIEVPFQNWSRRWFKDII